MAIRIFILKNVPKQEADEVRRLLESNHIEFYETPGSVWGISVAAIWLRNDADLEKARSLIEAYQTERQKTVRAEYEQEKAAGRHETLWMRFRQNPLAFLIILGFILFILYVTVRPFFGFLE